jgi:serine/threonine-protein kinase
MAKQSREGEVLAGKYRLEKLLGKGAVGVVYRAQNTLIGRTVAIKVLRAEHATDEEVVGRFLREARAANLVRHPNVVDVLDIGRDDDGVPFIVQEFLEGEDFGGYVQRIGGQLTVEAALDFMVPIAEAVGYAHSRGVVHRDLKPENVFLARADGKIVPKLLDFGLSRFKLGPSEIRATATGMTMGSPAYMSPEQIEGSKELDARADVWALGVMLYEILSGQLPFSGDSHVAVFVQISWAEPAKLEELVPSIPRSLARVVDRCLRRTAADRYPTASELARDLHHIRDGGEIEPTRRHSVPVPPPPRGASAPSPPVRPTSSAAGSEARVQPAKARPARSAGSPIDHHLLEFNDGDRGASRAASSGLTIATLRPPPMQREAAPRRHPSLDGEIDVSMFWGGMALMGVAAATGALLTAVLHRSSGWPMLSWASGLFDGSSLMSSGLTAVVAVGSAGWLGQHALRSVPKRWALGLASLGLAVVGASVIGRLAGWIALGPSGGPAAWALPLAPCGLGLHFLGRAWSSWRGGQRGAGMALAAAGTAALFVAVEFLRAAF